MTNENGPIRASDNIFEDLGIADADLEMEKAQLAHAIRAVIAASGFTQGEAARRMGTTQPKVSAIVGGKLAGFTSDRLMRFVRALECDVEITIRRRPDEREHGRACVVVAV